MVVEIAVGLVANSVALLSDALHMGTDVLGLGMALAAVQLAVRPARAHRTYGTYRLEVLAALANALLLFGVAAYIFYEAAQRLANPEDVASGAMLVVAVIGLGVNLTSFRLLTAGAKESLNVKGAFYEVLSDLLGSLGVILAALTVAVTGWPYADPLIGAGIGLFILPRTWRLATQAVRILMESAPAGIDVEQARAELRALPGVDDVHDLHIWTLTSGLDAASGHVTASRSADSGAVLSAVHDVLASRYQVVHATIQVEPNGFTHRPSPI